MDLHHALKTFATVVDESSFAKAAKRLYRSPAQVSKEVKWLEEHLNVKLLNRTTRALHITPAGQRSYEFARRLLDEVSCFKERVIREHDHVFGVLRVSVSVGFGESCLLEPINAFMKLYPDVRLEVEFTNRYVDLVVEDFDVVVRTDHPMNRSLVTKEIASSSRQVYASPVYLSKHGEPKTLEDLVNHQLIMHSAIANPVKWHFKNESISVRPFYLTNSISSMVKAAVDGLGLINLSNFHVHALLESGKLKEVLKSYRMDQVKLYICHVHQAVVPKRIAAFIDLIQTACHT